MRRRHARLMAGRGRLGLLRTVIRILAVVSALQLAGVAHPVGDIVELVTLGSHTVDDAEHENDTNHECPPGCPTCHHVHACHASLPAAVPLMIAVPLSEGRIAEAVPPDSAPLRPAVSAVYRPPRT